jgi:hypothetical protein
VRQVAVLDPRRPGRGVDLGQNAQILAGRERVVGEADPGVLPARRRLAEPADEMRDPSPFPERLGTALVALGDGNDLHDRATIPSRGSAARAA